VPRQVELFIDDLSTWYVRRSRRRFWKPASDQDKQAAYQTLYTCLLTMTRFLAPFMPFIAEDMYQNLARSVDPTAPDSVHLSPWPDADEKLIDTATSSFGPHTPVTAISTCATSTRSAKN
jgi:isoleucyl-tRNA synthetase